LRAHRSDQRLRVIIDLSGAVMKPRRLARSLVSSFCLAAFASFGCKQAPPAASPDGAVPSAVEPGARAGQLRSRFAGIMPRGLTTAGVAELGGNVYVVGGYFGSPHDYSREFQSGSVLRMRIDSGAWEELAAVTPIQSPAVASDGQYLYKLGGLRALNAAGQPTELRSLAESERFDPAHNRWEALPDLPEPRSSHQAVVVDGRLYVVGGWRLEGGMNDNVWSETMLTADLRAPTLTWNSVKVPFQVRAQGLVAHAGKLYVLAGLEPSGSTDAVHVYDIASGSWSDGPALPTESMTVRGAVYAGQLLANASNGSVYRLSADGASWELAGATQYGRLFHEMVSSEHGPLVLGGIPDNNRGGRIRVIERLSHEPVPAGVIMKLASEGPAKNRQGAFVWSQQLFVFGGNNSLGAHDFEQQNFIRNAARLDLGALEWRPVPEFPAARQSMQALVVGQEETSALVVGGFGVDGNVLGTSAEVYRHDIMKREWAALPEKKLPEGRSQFGLAQWNGAVWLFGGMSFDGSRDQDSQTRHTAQISRLDLSRPDASFEDAGVVLHDPRRAFAGALLDGTYYVVGGIGDQFAPVAGCEAVDLSAKQTRPFPCPSQHRLSAELVALGGKLYLAGGSVANARGEYQPSAAIEVFDPKSNTWAVLPASVPLDTPEMLRAFAYQDQLLLYSAQRTDGQVQVALLDPAALAEGRTDYVRVDVPRPLQ
jgi:N-acetylneuraminic acid mutarotase